MRLVPIPAALFGALEWIYWAVGRLGMKDHLADIMKRGEVGRNELMF